MMPGARRITMKLIADKAGTSISTVERALKNRLGISQTTKENVLRVARELGYLPGSSTHALRPLGKIRLGLVYPTEPDAFYRQITAGINAAQKDLQALGVEVEHIRYASQCQELEAEALEHINPAEFNALAINSAGPGIGRYISRFIEQGLPVITFNTDVSNSMRRFFVGCDSLQAGHIAAMLAGGGIFGEGNVLAIGNRPLTQPYADRLTGFKDMLGRKFPHLKVHSWMECCAKPEETDKRLAAQLNALPLLRGIFCTGYYCTARMINVLKSLNRKDMLLIGFDTSNELLDALEDGWCDVLLYQNPYRQGYVAVEALAQYVQDARLPEISKINMATQIVIEANACNFR